MVLTSYFTTKKDWQRGKYAKPSFSKIQTLGSALCICSLVVSCLDKILSRESSNFLFSEEALPDSHHKWAGCECPV